MTFNILGVPEGTNRPWQLDSVPLVLGRAEWTRAWCRALAQRARVLELFLGRLLRRAASAARTAWCRRSSCSETRALRAPATASRRSASGGSCCTRPTSGASASGEFTLFSDRTAAPTGAGYALENRLVLGRTLADLFREYAVERVASFFAKMRAASRRWRRSRTAEPRVVVLSAGAEDESSFEHAYLARYLGYELVEGRDLTVRERYGLLEDTVRPAPRRRASCAACTMTGAIRCISGRIRPGRWRGWSPRRASATWRSPTRSARHRPGAGSKELFARALPLFHRRGAGARAPCPKLLVRRAEVRWRTCSSISTSS